MNQVNQSLSFEVVAVPQSYVATATPIKVKIRMKKRDNKGITRQGVISISKMKTSYPKNIRKVHSDETIMSFDIHMTPEEESKPRRKSHNKFFHLFKTGVCLDTQDEDEYDPPYILSSSVKSKKDKPERLSSKLHAKTDEKSSSKDKFTVRACSDISKTPNIVFGKCKPGGCLDPPFGEDTYKYHPPIPIKHELKEKEGENLIIPSNKKSDEDKKDITNNEMLDKNVDESDASSTFMLYKANSRTNVLNDKYSDSIITYPTITSSRDLSILDKSTRSRKSSLIRNRELTTDTYFTPAKIRQSLVRKIEPANKINIEKKTVQKEEMRQNLPNEISIAEHSALTLSQNNDMETVTLPTKSYDWIKESNYKLPHEDENSENIDHTENPNQKIISYIISKPDAIENSSETEINIRVNAYSNIPENIKSKTMYDIGDDVSILNNVSDSLLSVAEETSYKHQNQKKFTNNDTMISSTKQVFNENNADEFDQVCYAISNDQRKKQLLHVESTENLSKLPSVQDENRKQVKNSDNELHYTEKQLHKYLYDTKDNKPEVIIHDPYRTEEVGLEISTFDGMILKPQINDLSSRTAKLSDTVMNESYKLISDNQISNKQNSECVMDLADSLGVDKISHDFLRTSKELNVNLTHEFDSRNNSIYYSSDKDYLTEKTSLSDHTLVEPKNTYEKNIVTSIDNEFNKIKEPSSIENHDICVDRESMIKVAVESGILPSYLPSNTVIMPPDFQNNTALSITHKTSKEVLLQRNSKIAKLMLDVDNITKLDPYVEKETFLSHENMSNNTSIENVYSRHAGDTSPEKITNKEISTLPIAIEKNISNYDVDNIKINAITGDVEDHITDTKRTQIYKETDKPSVNETVINESPPIKSVSSNTEYSLMNNSASNASVGIKQIHDIVNENRNDSTKVFENHELASETANMINIPVQQTLENILPDLENESLDKISQKNMADKPSLVEPTKHLKAINELGILHYSASKETVPIYVDKSHLNTYSNKEIFPVVQLVNTNNVDMHVSSEKITDKNDEFSNTKQIPQHQYYNESLEITSSEIGSRKDVEWSQLNNIMKTNSRPSITTDRDKKIIVSLGFQTYTNESGETVLKSFDVSQEPQRLPQDRTFVTKSKLKLNDSTLSFAIDSNTRLSININKTGNSTDATTFEIKGKDLTEDTTQCPYRNSKILYDANDMSTLQESLHNIYENDLIPIEKLIRSLRLEVDRITKNHMRNKSTTAAKKLKPSYSKRCICTRKWNNSG